MTVLDEVEAPAAMEALFELFKERNGITIDGAVVQPLPARLETDFEVDPGDPSLPFVGFGARAVAKTRLTMRYPVKSAPERVGIQWGVYPPNYALEEATGEAPPIEIICRLAANGVERIVQLTAAEPEFIWHRESEGGRARFAEVPALERQDEAPFPWLPAGCAAAALLAALFGPRGLRRGLFGPAAVALVAYTAVAHAAAPSSCRSPTRPSRSSSRCTRTSTAPSTTRTRATSTTRWRRASRAACSRPSTTTSIAAWSCRRKAAR